MQICRVEDLLVTGIMKGSIIHIHRARTVIVDTDGMITASELGNLLSALFNVFHASKDVTLEQMIYY